MQISPYLVNTSSAIPAPPNRPPRPICNRAPVSSPARRHARPPTPLTSIPKLGWRKVSKASFAFALADAPREVSDAGRGTAATDRRVSSEARFLCAVCTCRVIPRPRGGRERRARDEGDRELSDSNSTSRAPRRRRRRRRRRRETSSRVVVASIGRAMKRRGRRAREGASFLGRSLRRERRALRGGTPLGLGRRERRSRPREVGDARSRRCVLAGARSGASHVVRTCACDAECFEGGFRFRRRAFQTSASFDENASRDNLVPGLKTVQHMFRVHNPQPNPIIPLVENVFRDRRLAGPRFSLGVTFSARIDTPTASRSSSLSSTHTHTH